MKLDHENDRRLLLDIIGAVDIKGAAAPAIADLIRRVQKAEIDSSSLTEPRGNQDGLT